MTSRISENREIDSDSVEWIFSVTVAQPILSDEYLAITGGSESLGNWELDRSKLMDHKDGKRFWMTTVKIPQHKEIPYRYFICIVNPNTGNKIVRKWETHLESRTIKSSDFPMKCQDVFGIVNNEENVQRGWLTTETILQLIFLPDSFILPEHYENCLIYIKINPRTHQLCNENQEHFTNMDTSHAIVEVVRFRYGKSVLQPQDNFGSQYAKGDTVIFHISVINFSQLAYLIQLFCWEDHKKLPTCLGYNHLFSNDLINSEGQIDLPILNPNSDSPIGIMKFKYLIIKPMASGIKQNLRISLAKHWKNEWTGLDIGHRGSGTSFSVKDTEIPENTIASIRNAATSGVDMVEFDVHLTKDLIPIVFHDFHVNISLKCNPKDVTDLLQIAVKDLTLKQLRSSKIYHILDGVIKCCSSYEVTKNMGDYEPFPLLEELFDVIDPNTAFDIELKWPQKLINGAMEGKQTIDKNVFVDKILEVLFRKGQGRRALLTSFDVDICTMLRFKQNIYPVMFLALGTTEKYPLYMEPRCTNLEKAVCSAQAMDLLGVILHSEDFLKDPSLVHFAKKMKQVVFCWGDDSRKVDILLALKDMGLDGIIYDRCDTVRKAVLMHNHFRAEAKWYSELLTS